MQWIFFLFLVLLVSAIAWAIIEYRNEQRKDEAIFDEYLENQRKLKFTNRGKILRALKRRV